MAAENAADYTKTVNLATVASFDVVYYIDDVFIKN